jgi:hypothetical protein
MSIAKVSCVSKLFCYKTSEIELELAHRILSCHTPMQMENELYEFLLNVVNEQSGES